MDGSAAQNRFGSMDETMMDSDTDAAAKASDQVWNQADVLAYAVDLIAELKAMAEGAELPVLASYLTLAHAEAVQKSQLAEQRRR
jgi:hypothetical protein